MTMAIAQAASQRLRKGTVGGETYYTSDGQTVVRESVNATGSGKGTRKQMQVRTRWNNLGHCYNAFEGNLRGNFETTSSNGNAHNQFFLHNMQRTPVYLTKKQSAAGGCVICDYQVSQGSLRSIRVSGQGVDSYTDISLGSLQITADTTIGQLTAAIRANNDNNLYLVGDEICYYSCLQTFNASTKTPYVIVDCHRLVLNHEDTKKVWDALSKTGFSSKTVGGVNYLSHGESVGTGAFAWVHGRSTSDSKRVSSQELICCNDDMIALFSSEEAFESAAESYGVKDEEFVHGEDTTTEGQSQEALSVLVSSLRMAVGSTPSVAIGTVGEQTNFALSASKVLTADDGSVVAVEVRGTNLDQVDTVQLLLGDGTLLEFAASTASSQTGELLVVCAQDVTALSSYIKEVYVDATVVWKGKAVDVPAPPTPETRYTQTVSVGSGMVSMGSVSGGGRFAEGTEVTIHAVANEGYEFKGWKLNGGSTYESTNADYTFEVEQDNSFVAEFAEETETVTLTVGQDTNPNWGDIQINDRTAAKSDSLSVEAGTEVTIKAIAATGYSFSSWSDGNTNATRTITLTENKTLNASFESR